MSGMDTMSIYFCRIDTSCARCISSPQTLSKHQRSHFPMLTYSAGADSAGSSTELVESGKGAIEGAFPVFPGPLP